MMIVRCLRILSLILGFLGSSALSDVAGLSFEEKSNLPNWVMSEGLVLSEHLVVETRLNPFYLTGDFDGDGKLDIALLIRNLKTDEAGIAIAHRDHSVFIFGAGTDSNNHGSNFSWMDAWSVYPKGIVLQGATDKSPPDLVGDAVLVMKLESSSAIIYWDGAQYHWYQQGD